MTFLHSLRAATVCTAAIVGGALVSLPAATAIPISGVTPSVAKPAAAGPRLQGPFPKTAGVSSVSSVAKGRPMALPTTTKPSDWLLGMKR